MRTDSSRTRSTPIRLPALEPMSQSTIPLESTRMQIQPVIAETTPAIAPRESAPPAIAAGVPQLVGGRYRVLSLRGTGAEAAVHLAIDLFSGQEVALKVAAPARLMEEYRRCAELTHPHLARALSLWRSGPSAALAFEYGADDLSVLRGAPEALVVRHMAEIARGLCHLHRRGIVHGDVKPENAVLAGATGKRKALLVDLGLGETESAARGSLEYAAPEVLEGAAPDAASDLYSLGVTLHELLSGFGPFAAPASADVVRAHFEPAPAARASAGVQAVVAKLLARDPRSRYAHSDEVIEALAAATGLSLECEGEGLSPDRIALGQLQGREAELARIEVAARRAVSGNGEMMLVAGASGSGRSRLLRAASASAELAGLRTIFLEQGEGLAALCRRLDLLLGAAASFDASVGAAREKLAGACAQHPLAVLIDDADRSTDWLPALLLALARDPVWKRRPLLVVAAGSQQFQAPVERLDLQPLVPASAKAKLLDALGPRTWAEGLAERLVRESSGQPRDLETALCDLARRALLARRRGRWELDALRAGADFAGCVPRSASRSARAAVAALPRVQQSELGLAAVLWPELDAAALAGHEAALVAGGLRVAEELKLSLSQLALSRAAERALSRGERQNAHLRASQMTADPAARAMHLFHARQRGVVRAAIAAARARLRTGTPLEAARLYQTAEAALRHPLRSVRAAV